MWSLHLPGGVESSCVTVWESEFLRTGKCHPVFEVFVECQAWCRAMSEMGDLFLNYIVLKMCFIILYDVL